MKLHLFVWSIRLAIILLFAWVGWQIFSLESTPNQTINPLEQPFSQIIPSGEDLVLNYDTSIARYADSKPLYAARILDSESMWISEEEDVIVYSRKCKNEDGKTIIDMSITAYDTEYYAVDRISRGLYFLEMTL